MNCLVACLIWTGGYGYHDVCPARVEVKYKTQEYLYVTVLQGPTIQGDTIKMDISIHQRVKRSACK
jgi:hypothetical protein